MTRNFLHICIIAVCTSLWSSQNVQADNVRILALGDSLTAGYGLQKEEAFTTVLQKYLRAQGHDVTIINGGVSGDTSAGGLARLDWLLVDNPQIVILELG
ncbi:MAG: GDSL-type esterase/lipase family protein, partial [Pseudomonadota bacterium]